MLLKHHLRPALQRCSFAISRSQSTVSNDELKTLLSKPTWSLKSLLPESSQETSSELSSSQLRHLLRLSALPQPRTPEEEKDMLKTLSSQIHFVKEVQAVDTNAVEPLRALRDETDKAIDESTVGLEQMRQFLDQEEVIGRNRRIRRLETPDNAANKDIEHWDPLELAQEKRGRYFVVRRDKVTEKKN